MVQFCVQVFEIENVDFINLFLKGMLCLKGMLVLDFSKRNFGSIFRYVQGMLFHTLTQAGCM